MAKFNANRLLYMKALAAICPSMRFNKIESKIVCAQRGESTGFIFSFPKTDFDFSGNTASFQDYKEFISILSMLSPDSDMSQSAEDARYLTFTDSTQNIKVNYTLTGDKVDLSCGPTNFNFGAPDATIEMTAAEFSKIKKFISAVSAEKIKITVKEKVCTLKCFQDSKGDSVVLKYPVTGTAKDIDYVTTADLFILPPENDISLNLAVDGRIQLAYKNLEKDVSLSIFTGILEE